MNCYICTLDSHPGGTHYGVSPAIGLCHTCGIGLCLTHSRKAEAPGAPLHCPECARLMTDQDTTSAATTPIGSTRTAAQR